MSDSPQTEFQVISQAFGSWNVKFRIETAELLNQEALLFHLRRIKNSLSKQYTVDEGLLVFEKILREDRSKEYIDVIVRITQQEIEKGNPRVHFEDAIAPEGTRYANMTALLDIFYLDQFDKPIMLDRVNAIVRKSNVAESMIDWERIGTKLKEVLAHKSAQKNIVIAQGIFPAVGNDAKVDFYFPAVVKPGNADTYYSSRRVSKGDVLCKVYPATSGAAPGRNVLGEALHPIKGLDIQLNAQEGCLLSLDGYEAIADQDGVVMISRTMRTIKTLQGVKEIPQTIDVKVNQIRKVEGNQVIDFVGSGAIEVNGNLAMGSRILSDSEVYISGNVEAGTVVDAADDVTVKGDIAQASIHSEKNIIAQQDVSDSNLVARDQVIIRGTARNSYMQGETVYADTVIGGSILAHKKVTIARVGADEDRILSTICVGKDDYFVERIRDNELFISKAKANLTQIETVFGADIMREINEHNTQLILMRVLSKYRLGYDRQSREQAVIYRKLLESVIPTRVLMAQKEKENAKLKQRLKDEPAKNEGMVVITERMAAGTSIHIDGIQATAPAVNKPAVIKSDEKDSLVVSFGEVGNDSDGSDNK